METDFIYGNHAVRHALLARPEQVLELWVQKEISRSAIREILTLAERAGIAVQIVPRATLDKMADEARHQGTLLRQRRPAPMSEDDLYALLDKETEPPLLLVLEGIQDPHNLGACLRTANAAGVNAVVIPVHRGTGLTAAVRKVASGAAELTPLVQVRNLARTLRNLTDNGIWLVGTAADASQTIFDVDLRVPLALVLGGEEKGLRRLSREHCDALVRLPMLGGVESLNVSVASGICLYEALRQRDKFPTAQ